MRQMMRGFVLVAVLAAIGGCQMANHQAAASRPAIPSANPFVGYWRANEIHGKSIVSTNSFQLDIVGDGTAILIATQPGIFIQPPPPDELRTLHWEAIGSGIRIIDLDRKFDGRLEGDSTLVITGPNFYVRMNRSS